MLDALAASRPIQKPIKRKNSQEQEQNLVLSEEALLSNKR
jgi:hypothetical protein